MATDHGVPANLALRWLSDHNESPCFDFCVDLAGEVVEVALAAGSKADLVWIDGPLSPDPQRFGSLQWRHHAVAMVDGLVHDVWVGDPVPLDAYLALMFPDQDVVTEVIGDDPDA